MGKKFDLERVADRLLAQTGLTAVGVGVSTVNDEADIAVAGVRCRKRPDRVALDDRWHIGSVGKSLTAVLVASLFEDRYPDLDGLVSELLPNMELHDSWRNCTLYHLLTSTSGLPPNFPLRSLLNSEDDPQKLIELRHRLLVKALAKPARFPCGTKFMYSNLGYTLLGHIAEVTAGQPFNQLLRENVLNPLSLDSTGFGAPKGETEGAQPMGHQVLFGYRKAFSPFHPNADNPALMAPAGRLHMSLSDLLKYGKAHLTGRAADSALLRKRTWNLLHRPNLNDYGCGWVSQKNDWVKGELIWHNGSNKRWYTLLLLLPEEEVVMAFVTNDGAIRRAERAFFAAAKELAKAIPKRS